MTIGIKVSLMGFSRSDQEKFDKIFRFSRFRHRRYIHCTHTIDNRADILIVNSDVGTIEQDKNEFITKDTHTPIVVATKKEGVSRYRIKGSLFGDRILKALDQIDIRKRKPERRRKMRHSVVPYLLKGNKKDDKTLFLAKEKSKNKPSIVEKDPAFDVLVVDDSPSMQKMLELEFAQTAMETRVSTAETGEQALECVAERNYDFIFLDVMMPGIDGYETCSRIRKYPQMKKTPIIMLSAKTSPLDEVKGIMAGCTTYLTKPIKHEEFQKVVARILRWLDEYKTPEQPCGAISK